MARSIIRTFTKDWQAAVVGSNETTRLFTASKGDVVLSCVVIPLVNAAPGTTSTIEVGDTNDTDRYVTTSNVDLRTSAVGTPVSGTGAGLSSAPYAYPADSGINIVYTANSATGAKPAVRVIATILRTAGA
jgi:hypothetical protein